MQYLRQSTAAVLRVGPYISAADGKTPVTGLATPTGKAIQGGTATAYTPATWADLGDGHYAANLSTGQTATTGPLRVEFPATASYLSVWEDADVVSGPWYDLVHAANGSGGIVAAGATGTFPTADSTAATTAQAQTAALYNGSAGGLTTPQASELAAISTAVQVLAAQPGVEPQMLPVDVNGKLVVSPDGLAVLYPQGPDAPKYIVNET